jgi:hypothetical protein
MNHSYVHNTAIPNSKRYQLLNFITEGIQYFDIRFPANSPLITSCHGHCFSYYIYFTLFIKCCKSYSRFLV